MLAEYGLADRAFELNRLSAALAREACARFDEPGRPRFVCGSMGPTTKAISVTGGVTFEELIEHFRVQALGLMAGGADYLLLETCQDTRNIKAGLLGIEQAFARRGLARCRSRSRSPSSPPARCSPGRTPRRSRSRSCTPTCSTSA